ncbi:MAG: cytochrome c [Acidobacteriota bacterium]|nr:cytochrome c [Acidobacteriota bacterium]
MRRLQIVVIVGVAMASMAAQGPALRDGIYTTEQADRGAALYEEQCVACHGELRAFTPEMAALLADHTFRNRWKDRPLGELFTLVIEEMPQDAPGTLSPENTADLLAYMLQGNRIPAGESTLSPDIDVLDQIRFQ